MSARHRFARKVDDNHRAVVSALRACGVRVVDLSRLGGDVLDLLCLYRGRATFLEVKDGAKPPNQRRLTPGQAEFIRVWRAEGGRAERVLSPEEAVRAATGKRILRRGDAVMGSSELIEVDAPEFGALHEEDLGDQREGET